MKKIFFFALGLVLATALAAQNTKLPQNISLKDIDGQTVQSSVIQNNGKPIIISFWATWCKPCNLELNTIKEVYDRDFARALNVGPNPPHTFVVNGEGEIVWQHTGYLPGAEEEVIEKVRELLK